MRYRTFLLIVTVALLAPANLRAQVESPAQIGKPAPTKPAERAAPCPPFTKTQQTIEYEMAVAHSTAMIRSYKPGQHLIIRLNNQRERVGKLLEAQSDYFLLTTSKGTEKIAYIDVDAVKTKRSLGEHIGRILMMPIKGIVYGIVYGGLYTLVGIGYFVDSITGHRR